MLPFIIRRLLQAILVLFLVTILTFGLLKLIPGDAVYSLLGPDASQEEIDYLRQSLGLDLPVYHQYTNWLFNVLQGDLGTSLLKHEPVGTLIVDRLPVTFYISFLALILSTIAGILAGTISAIRRGGYLDNIISLLSNIGIAMPTFWLGILGIYLFGLLLHWLPVQGFSWPWIDFTQSVRQLIMPVICLAVPSIAIVARQTRSSLLEVIRQDYVRTARAKGLHTQSVVFKHSLRNALIPVITLIGIQVRILVGGSVIVETVFSIPGMGRLLVDAAFGKDILVVQGCVLVIAVVVILANLLVDVSYGFIDPRVRYE